MDPRLLKTLYIYKAEDDFEPLIFLPTPPKFKDLRQVASLVYAVLGINPELCVY